MDSLEVALAATGAALLLGIMIYNAWVLRRNTPRRPEREQPAAPGAAAEALREAPLPAAPAIQGQLDERIDCIIPIVLEGPVSGEDIAARMPPGHRIGSKLFCVEAHHQMTGNWEPPQHGWLYDACRTGVQLANRSGALTQVEFSEFVIKTQALAEALGGSAECPDMKDEVNRARSLDTFATGHDLQLALNLRARQTPWSLGFVIQQATRLGFVPGAVAGKLALPSPHAGMPHVLEISYDQQVALAEDKDSLPLRQLVLSLDVPQIRPEENAFESLLYAASALATNMDGVITDPQGQPLTESGLQELRQGLESFYETLRKHELPAGDAVTRRLFS